MEKVLVFAEPHSKHQPSNLIVLSGRRDGAVAKHKSLQTLTLRVTSSKEPLRVTLVSVVIMLFKLYPTSTLVCNLLKYCVATFRLLQ